MAVININRNQFEEMVHSGKTVLVEFSAPWCVYCRRLAPALESVAEEYKDTLVFTAVNIDDEPELAEAEAIEVVPTLLIYHSGQALGSIVAPESRAQLVAFIEETLQHQTQEANNAQHIYDMIVVGGGPGGYTAALYAARAGMDTVVLEKLSAGGQMALTEQIDNYPGFEDGIDGFSLGEKMKRGTERFGVETKLTEVLSLELSGSIKKAVTSEGPMYAKSIVLATGAGPRELGVDGEQELIGKGVHYCAACDGMFYRNKTVVIAGGGNTAAADALILSRICKKVIVVHRRDSLKATKIYHEPLMKFFFLFSDLTVLSVVLLFLNCQLMKFLIQRLTGWELCNLQFVKGLLRRFMNCDFLTVFLKELFAISSLAVLDIDLPCVAIIFDVLLQRLNLNHSFLCGLDRIRKRIEPGRQIFNMSGQIVVVAQTFFFQKDDGTGSFFSVKLLRPLFITDGFSFCHLCLNINQHLKLLRGRSLGRTAF